MRSLQKQKDPGAKKNEKQHLWASLSEQPKNQIKSAIPEFIRQKDKEACEHILEKLSEEQLANNMRKNWLSNFR